MLDFIRIACAVPAVRVGDTAKNAEDICAYIEKADGERADIVLFPELALTGYSCQDLFFQDTLWTGVQQGIRKIVDCTKRPPQRYGGGGTARPDGNADVQLRRRHFPGKDSRPGAEDLHSQL